MPLLRCPVVRPDSPLLRLDEARLAEEPQVMADSRLVLGKLRGQITDAYRLGLLHQQIEQAQPGGIGDGFEAIRQGFGVLRRQARCCDRAATRIVLAPSGKPLLYGEIRHVPTIAYTSTFING